MRSEFRRSDLRVTLSTLERDTAQATLHGAEPWMSVAFNLKPWREAEGAGFIPDDPVTGAIRELIPAWRKRAEGASAGRYDRPVARIVVDVRAVELAGYPWEGPLRELLHQLDVPAVVVRSSLIPPRVAALPLTYPIRILDLDPRPGREAGGPVLEMFGHQERTAIEVARGFLPEVEQQRKYLGWPKADIVHFGRYPLSAPPQVLYATGNPHAVGTLGWLARLVDTWQTRLVTLDCEDERELPAARVLAERLVSRGGPAVLVAGRDDGTFLRRFYQLVIHDWALDAALRLAHPAASTPPAHSLFVGTGREELLRVSNVAVELIELTDDLGAHLEGRPSRSGKEIAEMLTRAKERVGFETATAADIRDHLARTVRSSWPDLAFEQHEGHGLLPTADALEGLRRMTLAQARVAPPRGEGTRFVNIRLGRANEDGRLRHLDQTDAVLKVGEVYHLLVQIGPRDVSVRAYGASALVEEVFKWGPGISGRWLEVGVTGLDFGVVGDPVQEMWLPRNGATEEIAFAVVPRRAGAARLRVCVYLDQDIVQSFRLAAIAQSGPTRPSTRRRAAQLARALEIPTSEIGDVGFLARLEYSLATSADEFVQRPSRTLSIVVNDLDGEPWITVKGKDRFLARTESSVPDLVIKARGALDRVSVGADEEQDPATMPYWFGAESNINAGTPEQLDRALGELAAAGWRLFSQMLGADEGKRLGDELEGERATIHVAHILLPKAIPWALAYDRPYDRDRVTDQGRPVGHATCRAPLLAKDQGPATTCGTHPACLLSAEGRQGWEEANGKVLRSDTVACPLRFWGFQHVIELPPMQVDGEGQADELRACILMSPPVRVQGGVNTSLHMAAGHVEAVRATVTEAPINGTLSWARTRDEVVDDLDDQAVDVVYLYCHAQGGAIGLQQGVTIPVLLFAEANGEIGRIEAANLSGGHPPWLHSPLVFLNGCRTAGFSPDALSPFIETLVRDRRAAGVIGTEISVWEQVATEMAMRFLRLFLAGTCAGEALLEARRGMLIEKNNPLGLCYTLYAAADLTLDLDGDGQCPP